MIPAIVRARTVAEQRWSRGLRDYVAGGSGDERAVVMNELAFARLRVTPRVLTGGTGTDSSTWWGALRQAWPLGVAPMAFQGLAHADAELATARAAALTNTPFIVSTMTSTAVEDIAATGAKWWFQLYWPRSPRLIDGLLDRVLRAGPSAIVLTVDTPRFGDRRRDRNNAFRVPVEVRAAMFRQLACIQSFDVQSTAMFRDDLGWADVEALRRRFDLPFYLKGILDPRDARRAIGCGVDGLVVSNHGGRQFDGAPAPATVVDAIRSEVGERPVLLLDGGIRSGGDILRAIAVGADGVLLGRPVLWGLASGEQGVAEILQALHDDLDQEMLLCGCPDIAAVRQLRVRWDVL